MSSNSSKRTNKGVKGNLNAGGVVENYEDDDDDPLFSIDEN